ncbi:hypothetical protein NSTC731_04742 [Nostoc sp. DSM 114167]|jgi:hypothetical protein
MFRAAFNEKVNTNLSLYTYLINDCNTSLAKDAMNRVSTTGRQRGLGGSPHERLPWEPSQRAGS